MIPLAAGVGLASVAGNVVGGLLGSSAASKAASQQAQAIQQGIDYQKGVYSDAKGNLNPYIESGTKNLGTYQDMTDNYEAPTLQYTQEAFDFDKNTDPAVAYMAKQAAQAMQGTALAKGATGGGFARALQADQSERAATGYSGAYDRWLKNSELRYGQAKDQYNREYTADQASLDRYKDLATQGLTAGTALGSLGQQNASSISDLYSTMGSGNAAGTMKGAQSWINALQGIGSSLTTPISYDSTLGNLFDGIGSTSTDGVA